MGLWSRLRRALGGPDESLARMARSLAELTDLCAQQARQLRAIEKLLKDGDLRWVDAVERVAKKHDRELRDLRQERVRAERAWQERIDTFEAGLRRERKWRVNFSRQLSGLVRRACLPDDLPQPYALLARRFQLRSQFEEDGLLIELSRLVGVGDRRFVEIGSGRSGNFMALALDCGWSGLLVDSSAEAVSRIRRSVAANPGVTAVCAEVSPENVNDLLAAHGYTGEIDQLSIDIDSYDYWVLEAISAVRPRVLALEYNARFGPERSVTVPYGQPLADTPKGYHGASLAALTVAAGRKGFRLVCCEPSGVNAFFVRNDLAPELPAVPVREAFRPQLSRVEVDAERADDDLYAVIASRGLPLVEV